MKTRVVSMPCWELFEEQSLDYRQSVFPAGVPVLSVEAMARFGWERYAHGSIGMNTFGASAPAKDLFKRFGFTSQNVVEKAKKLVAYYQNQSAPSLLQRPF